MRLLGATLQIVPSESGRMTEKLTRDMIEAARVVSERTGAFWTDQMKNTDQLAHLIQGMAGIRWRVSRKVLKAFKDWVLRPSCPRERTEPHPPCPTIRSCRSTFQPSAARN
jgi:hypothetical protein